MAYERQDIADALREAADDDKFLDKALAVINGEQQSDALLDALVDVLYDIENMDLVDPPKIDVDLDDSDMLTAYDHVQQERLAFTVGELRDMK